MHKKETTVDGAPLLLEILDTAGQDSWPLRIHLHSCLSEASKQSHKQLCQNMILLGHTFSDDLYSYSQNMILLGHTFSDNPNSYKVVFVVRGVATYSIT